VTGRDSSYGEAYWRGYERGVQTGHAAGYVEGLQVLDDAAAALAQERPSRSVEVAKARQRMADASGPSLTPTQMRAQAAESWGLPAPTEPAEAADRAVEVAPVVAELADDDDWAWQA
jgi:hypothetical protein